MDHGVFAQLKELLGETLTAVTIAGDRGSILLQCLDHCDYVMFHDQNCCEEVVVEDVCGDLDDIVGAEIMQVSEDVSRPESQEYESLTLTAYTLRTHKGTVTFRWRGASNGYYGEEVEIACVGAKWVAKWIDTDGRVDLPVGYRNPDECMYCL
jgi:hypothetical protein